jgi:hypothetical protein
MDPGEGPYGPSPECIVVGVSNHPQPSQYLKELCISMPASFPADDFITFMARARSVLLNPKGAEWSEFAGASNLMGWRYRNAVECLDDFATSWEQYGDAKADHEEFYKRDRALFGLFSASVSCVEATCYGICALASHPRILGLPFGPKEQKRAYPSQVRDALKSKMPNAPLVQTLDTMLLSPEWEMWLELRNRTSHRSNLPRIITGVIGGGPLPPSPPMNVAATSSTKAFAADLDDLERRVTWLGATLQSLFVDAAAIIAA